MLRAQRGRAALAPGSHPSTLHRHPRSPTHPGPAAAAAVWYWRAMQALRGGGLLAPRLAQPQQHRGRATVYHRTNTQGAQCQLHQQAQGRYTTDYSCEPAPLLPIHFQRGAARLPVAAHALVLLHTTRCVQHNLPRHNLRQAAAQLHLLLHQPGRLPATATAATDRPRQHVRMHAVACCGRGLVQWAASTKDLHPDHLTIAATAQGKPTLGGACNRARRCCCTTLAGRSRDRLRPPVGVLSAARTHHLLLRTVCK